MRDDILNVPKEKKPDEQSSRFTQFGMSDADIDQRIEDFERRIKAIEVFLGI